jgi:sulfur carrier protein
MRRERTHAALRQKPCRLAQPDGGGDNTGMDIVLNGEPRAIAAQTTVLQLLQAEGLGERRVAVEVNGEIVPRGRHGEHALTSGDRVEIVHALGGG